jgi:hypothetical protein
MQWRNSGEEYNTKLNSEVQRSLLQRLLDQKGKPC